MKHKGLRRLIQADDWAGLPAATVDKVRKIIAFLDAMQDEDELRNLRGWKAHQMTGDRKGAWALHVTANWRITFLIDRDEVEIIDLDYEDYH